MEEYFDIYNDRKERTGRTMKRKGSFLREGEYCLIVLGVIRKPDGRFLITKRAEDKHWAPGAWEVPGGGVRAGESSREALLREVYEESGLRFLPEHFAKDTPSAEERGTAADGVHFAADEAEETLPRITLIDTYSNVDLKRGDNYFVDIYHILADFDEGDVVIDRKEATDFRLAAFDELTELEEAGAFMHYARIRTALRKAGLLED